MGQAAGRTHGGGVMFESEWGNCPKCGWPIHIPSFPSETTELTRWKLRVGSWGGVLG